MSPTRGNKGRNEQFLETLADELSDTPTRQLLEGAGAKDAVKAVVRLMRHCREEAARRRPPSVRKRSPAARGAEEEMLQEAPDLEDHGVDE